MNNARRTYLWGAAAVAAEVLGYLAWRPRMTRWGATDEEAAEPLPGDEITPHPRVRSTRAITIDAPPEKVWPWIVQMGMGRAGFYTHEWVERPLGGYYAEGHSATRIHPEFQDLQVGDLVDYGGGNLVPVHDIEPFKHLVHGEAWVLRPLPGDRTRLIVRYQGMGFIAPAAAAISPDAPAAVPGTPLRDGAHPRSGAGRPGDRLLLRRPPAPLHGVRDAEGDQGARRGPARWGVR
jgi:hypothetical protein